MKENRTLQWAIALLGTCVLLLGGYSISLSQRLHALETLPRVADSPVQEREIECPHSSCAVSIIQLLAHPARYDGKTIRVAGIYCSGFELSALFPAWSADALVREESIWVNNPGSNVDPSENECKEVEMSGLYKAGYSGHLNQHSGELLNVSTIVTER